MSGKYSFTDLLDLLAIETMDGFVSVKYLYDDVRALRRRYRYDKTIEATKQAMRLSHQAYDYSLEGVALLRLSLSRLFSSLPKEAEQAIRDCERAVLDFSLEPHNRSIAQMFRAQIDLHMEKRFDHQEEQWRQSASMNFREAAKTLQELIVETTSRGDLKRSQLYRDLRAEAEDNIRLIGTRPYADKASQQINRLAALKKVGGSQSGLMRVIGWRPIPLFSVAAAAGFPPDRFVNNAGDEQYVSDKFTIGGEPFTLHWPNVAGKRNNTLRLRQDREYYAVPIDGESMQPALWQGEYALTRIEDDHEHDGQIVVAMLGARTDSSPIRVVVKRARGFPQVQWLESDNPDKAKYPSLDPADPKVQADLYGIVEAVLKPLL